TLLWLFPSLERSTLWAPLLAIVLLVGAFVCIPLLLRVFLGLQPLPEGPLRQRLMASARRLGFRFNDILLWDTRNTTANAMVTGFVPFLRYVVLTDRLISELSEEEIEAVFGHEVGHVKHAHMLYYLGFLLASVAAVVGVCNVLVDAVGLPEFVQTTWPGLYGWLSDYQLLTVAPLVLALALYIFLVFGFLSRRCERQADIYGCRTVNCRTFVA